MRFLILRNLRLYFRDRLSILFSLMSIFIMLGLYILFLSDLIMSGELETLENGREILNLWLLAGLLSIASITTTFAAYGVMIQDRSKGIIKDLYASSVPRSKLVLSYMLSSWIIGIFMSVCTFAAGEIFIVINGGALLSIPIMLKICAAMLLIVGAGSAMMFFLANFLLTESSFSNASVLLGTLIGFLMGIYIPIGTLPSFAQSIIRFFPMSQGCSIYRQLLVQEPLRTAMTQAPDAVVLEIEEALGITLSYGSIPLSLFQNIVLMGAIMLLFYLLSLAWLRYKNA